MFLKRGHQVGVLSTQLKLKFLQKYRDKTVLETEDWNDNGIPTYYSMSHSVTPKNPHPSQLDLNLFLKRGYKKYKEYKSNHGKPDILHAQTTIWGGVLTNYISKKEKIPYFLTEHFSELILNYKYSDNNKPYKYLIEKTLNSSEQSFAVSHYFKNELYKVFNVQRDKLKVIPNIVNSIFHQTSSNQNFNECKVFKLVILGRLIELKNHLVLFQAIKKLTCKGIKINLDVVGDGELKKVLNNYISNNNLIDVINLHGSKNRSQVVELVKDSHALISASIFETFGISLIEGLASRKPIIALDSGGVRDIINPKNGILIKENSPEAFASAIQDVIDNYESYDQAHIAEDCMARFGEETIYQKLVKYYYNHKT
jgi:glycosyltransferase involved in cell wall biosynthesis